MVEIEQPVNLWKMAMKTPCKLGLPNASGAHLAV